MARARNIKPGFFKNELLAEVDPLDRLLFIGLWCLADREGRLEDRPKRIKIELFPCDNYDVANGISVLVDAGFLRRYSVGDTNVIAIANFLKHQAPHGTERDSDLPDENGCLTIHQRGKNGCVTGQKTETNVSPTLNNVGLTLDDVIPPEHNALNPDSLIPDSLIPDSSSRAETLAPAAAPAKKSLRPKAESAPATRLPTGWQPDLDQVAFCNTERPDLQPLAVGDRFRDYWIAQPGVKGRKADWDATWRNWVRNERAQPQARASPASVTRIDQTRAAARGIGLGGDNHDPENYRTIDITPYSGAGAIAD